MDPSAAMVNLFHLGLRVMGATNPSPMGVLAHQHNPQSMGFRVH